VLRIFKQKAQASKRQEITKRTSVPGVGKPDMMGSVPIGVQVAVDSSIMC
jgi:hypothetical protein